MNSLAYQQCALQVSLNNVIKENVQQLFDERVWGTKPLPHRPLR